MKKLDVRYTGIGHRHPDDILWIVRGLDFECIKRVTDVRKEQWTHSKIWGDQTKTCWHGVYHVRTGTCSIAAPEDVCFKRPPMSLLDILRTKFSMYGFAYVANPRTQK
jgi:hypothetical protein